MAISYLTYPSLVGQQFGKLTVIEFAGHKNRQRAWKCKCVCGGFTDVTTGHLRSGHTKSCGCGQLDGARLGTHGMTKTSTYRIWGSMVQRCTDVKSQAYPHYGGRGITVCEQWLKFENFYTDMGERPKGLSLERKDNDKGYSPENCVWATQTEQCNNRRNNRLVTCYGRTLTVAQWARELGIKDKTIHERLRRGWTEEKAVSTKVA